ncbi:MAG: hypothetical protein OXC30_04960 [Alphaproteobacteria bacterium]|nr:hypothetical protein [Alphaproteobacteria bacterium]
MTTFLSLFSGLLYFLSFAAQSATPVRVAASSLTRITIPGRYITRIMGMPETTVSLLDQESGSLFVEANHGFYLCLFDEYNTPYDIFIVPTKNGPYVSEVSAQTPNITAHDVQVFLTKKEREIFQKTVTNTNDQRCDVTSLFAPDVCIISSKRILEPFETTTLYYIDPVNLKNVNSN